MAQDIPQWAIDKANKLIDGAFLPGRHYSVGAENAFAAYIAAHEEPPVDPLHQIAREIVASFYPEHGPEVLEGGYDSSRRIDVAVTALRRGIELASKSEPLP